MYLIKCFLVSKHVFKSCFLDAESINPGEQISFISFCLLKSAIISLCIHCK
ncbi:hypothetical protein Hanom_Chr15g01412371 [Helianthus anomalus]